MSSIEKMMVILREADIPFFSEEDLQFYLDENNGDINAALYQCLLIKSEDTTLEVNGLSIADSSKYFKRLAARYRPNNTGTLVGD